MEKLPSPPKLSPPPQVIETDSVKPKKSIFEIDIQKLGMKEKLAPKSEENPSRSRAIPKPPKAQPPKQLSSSPKINIPKINIKTPKVQIKPTKLELQNSDNFVFSEVSLKGFVGDVKSKKGQDLDIKKTKQETSKIVETSLTKAKPGATISLFNFKQDSNENKTSISKNQLTSPRGVPTISKWRENRDGSISGFINGAREFDDGDAITTSPIVMGNINIGSVVETGSGSK